MPLSVSACICVIEQTFQMLADRTKPRRIFSITPRYIIPPPPSPKLHLQNLRQQYPVSQIHPLTPLCLPHPLPLRRHRHREHNEAFSHRQANACVFIITQNLLHARI